MDEYQSNPFIYLFFNILINYKLKIIIVYYFEKIILFIILHTYFLQKKNDFRKYFKNSFFIIINL